MTEKKVGNGAWDKRKIDLSRRRMKATRAAPTIGGVSLFPVV